MNINSLTGSFNGELVRIFEDTIDFDNEILNSVVSASSLNPIESAIDMYSNDNINLSSSMFLSFTGEDIHPVSASFEMASSVINPFDVSIDLISTDNIHFSKILLISFVSEWKDT